MNENLAQYFRSTKHSMNDQICECGSDAFEIPNEDGCTWCAECGEEYAPEDPPDDDTDERPRRREHRAEVAEVPARPIEVQISERLAGAGLTARSALINDCGEVD